MLPHSELRGEYGWSKLNYATNFPVAKELVKDNVERINCKKTSHEEFVKKYERPAVPVVLLGAQENWRAVYKWNLEVKPCCMHSRLLFKFLLKVHTHCL